ncbi:hypothetical protein [Tychonema sp. LEGE 07203]|uniref:hypothetical protein n=1 Tax=Tychonema sp. LEGE 07203 TaxID=1828671 RepID=UPI00351C8453
MAVVRKAVVRKAVVIGYWLLVIGYWLLVIGYWLSIIIAVLNLGEVCGILPLLPMPMPTEPYARENTSCYARKAIVGAGRYNAL